MIILGIAILNTRINYWKIERNEIYHKNDSELIKYKRKYYLTSQCFRNYIKNKEGWRTAETEFIPKTKAIIAYNLTEDATTGEIYFHQRFLPDTSIDYFILNDGTYIVKSNNNRKLLKKFKNKYYLLSKFAPPNKNQLMLNFR